MVYWLECPIISFHGLWTFVGGNDMATTQTESKRSGTRSASSGEKATKGGVNAIQLLTADHRKVEDLFEEFESATRKDRKAKIAQQICQELLVHTQIEEQAFYPEAQDALGDEADLVDEAQVEHASVKWLIQNIQDEPESDLFEARVTVLKEYVDHHVKEEEKQMFPKIKKSDLDLEELGESMLELKERITKELKH
jgi:hemerythrin superfamily protein